MAVSGFTKGDLVRNQYEVRGELGRGGFSVVYKAYDQRLKRDVAIKVCDPSPKMCFDDARQRFHREARILARIEDPRVVTIYNYGQRRKRLYFVMEYLPYSLHDLIEDYLGDPVPYEDASHVLKQILEGLTAIHTKGLTHRDIKPSNILMHGDNVKLADFGIVKDSAEGMTGSHTRIGTPGWMAPEQRWGRQTDPRSDVYSFGLVAYQMLTGYSPEDVDGSVEFSMCNINRRLADLLASCTLKDSSDRPANAEEVLEKWLRIEESMRYKPPRSRRVRSDARIGTVMSRIENAYGLPSGSVFFRYPGKRRPVQRNVTVLKLRQRWEEH